MKFASLLNFLPQMHLIKPVYLDSGSYRRSCSSFLQYTSYFPVELSYLPFNRLTLPTDLTNFMFMHRLVSMTAIENFHQPRRGVKNSEAVCIIPVTHASLTLWAASTPALVAPQLHRITRVSPQTEQPAHRPLPSLH